MYDYLGENQIKIFYNPIFEKKDFVTGKPKTWHSGGRLKSYDENSNLPLKTLYYKYPNSFIVSNFDYDYVFIIKDGKFINYKHIKDLQEKDLGEAVFDYYGKELNIRTIRDFKQFKEDNIKYRKEYDRLTNKLFPDGIFNILKNNLQEYKNKKPMHDQNYENTLGIFYNKWFKEDKFDFEKQFGKFIECYIYFELDKDREPILNFNKPMDMCLCCKQVIKEFINENEGIVERYLKWVDSEVITKKELNDILKEIMEL